MTQTERRRFLINALLAENPALHSMELPTTEQEEKMLLRALFNVRMPGPASSKFLEIQDAYLQEEIRQKGVTFLTDLQPVRPGLYLWQGDITTLQCDAIVNAANPRMLGCFCPNHGCIDNAIHTFAGIQLRMACAALMKRQGHEEKPGRAKITPAFNLPCQYILHTVGPMVRETLSEQDKELLASCYWSCLRLADKTGIKSITFCCISTGEFRFPHFLAAEIAVNTVREYKEQTNSNTEVIFNVFKDSDYDIYRSLLGTD